MSKQKHNTILESAVYSAIGTGLGALSLRNRIRQVTGRIDEGFLDDIGEKLAGAGERIASKAGDALETGGDIAKRLAKKAAKKVGGRIGDAVANVGSKVEDAGDVAQDKLSDMGKVGNIATAVGATGVATGAGALAAKKLADQRARRQAALAQY